MIQFWFGQQAHSFPLSLEGTDSSPGLTKLLVGKLAGFHGACLSYDLPSPFAGRSPSRESCCRKVLASEHKCPKEIYLPMDAKGCDNHCFSMQEVCVWEIPFCVFSRKFSRAISNVTIVKMLSDSTESSPMGNQIVGGACDHTAERETP